MQNNSRKKSRCPGEKPNCSHCTRLRQNCYYAEERHEIERIAASGSLTPQPRPSMRTDGRLVSWLSLYLFFLFCS